MTGRNKIGSAIGVTSLVVFGMSIASSALANQTTTPDVIQQLRERGHTVTALGKTGVLSGWYVEAIKGNPYTIYTTEDGQSLIGKLYGKDNTLVTGLQIQSMLTSRNDEGDKNYTKVPNALKMTTAQTQEVSGQSVHEKFKALAKETRNLNGFKIGDRGPTVQVFVDPFCPYSRRHVDNIKRQAQNGTIQATIIPVSIFPNSQRHAAAITSSPNGLEVWDQLHRSVRVNDDQLSSNGVSGLEQNNKAFLSWGARGVPLTIMGNTEGADVQKTAVEYGKPRTIQGMLKRGGVL